MVAEKGFVSLTVSKLEVITQADDIHVDHSFIVVPVAVASDLLHRNLSPGVQISEFYIFVLHM